MEIASRNASSILITDTGDLEHHELQTPSPALFLENSPKPSPTKYKDITRTEIAAGPLEVLPLSAEEQHQKTEAQIKEKEAMMR